jgi:hypothetical protein
VRGRRRRGGLRGANCEPGWIGVGIGLGGRFHMFLNTMFGHYYISIQGVCILPCFVSRHVYFDSRCSTCTHPGCINLTPGARYNMSTPLKNGFHAIRSASSNNPSTVNLLSPLANHSSNLLLASALSLPISPPAPSHPP